MFAQARRDMEKEMADTSLGYSGYGIQQSFFMDETQRRQLMEQRINQTAETLATQFIAEQSSDQGSSPSPSVSKDQAFLVYKFLNTSQDMLVAGMAQMQPHQLIQFYRKLAIQLHPDKNKHPKAKDAFQVVQAAMESAKASMRSATKQGTF